MCATHVAYRFLAACMSSSHTSHCSRNSAAMAALICKYTFMNGSSVKCRQIQQKPLLDVRDEHDKLAALGSAVLCCSAQQWPAWQ